MPAHDWTQVDAGLFHDFHHSWIFLVKQHLNNGVLPEGFYAMAEQHAAQPSTPVLGTPFWHHE